MRGHGDLSFRTAPAGWFEDNADRHGDSGRQRHRVYGRDHDAEGDGGTSGVVMPCLRHRSLRSSASWRVENFSSSFIDAQEGSSIPTKAGPTVVAFNFSNLQILGETEH